MKIQTATLSPNLPPHIRHQVYNGLDCCLTFEIFEHLSKQLQQKNKPHQQLIYNFERGMQGPALELMERGWLIDEEQRKNGQDILRAKKTKFESILNQYGFALWDKPINANSPAQLKKLFYEVMGFPEHHSISQGQRRVSTNREALEKLSIYFYAIPLVNVILAIRETTKKLSVLETEVSPDGRMRTSYNVAGTETGRWSSSSSADGSGTNLQNITPELRRMFISDIGWKLCYLDLEQAESRVVGLLVRKIANDSSYLDACESGDLHTTTAKLVWPDLGWTDNDEYNRTLADQKFYRHFSYRDMAKRGGHGTNYVGTPRTMARHLKVDEHLMIDFQKKYFKAFPGIPEWHKWVKHELNTQQSLTTLLGRKRVFYGRTGDDTTLREAIAHEPQSIVGDILNTALWRIWKAERRVQILGQIHDAIVFQYPDDQSTEVEILNRCLELTHIPITANNRTITIPSECKVGYNWANADIGPKFDPTTDKKLWHYDDGNPLGLIKWRGIPDDRRRLDRQFSSVY